MMPAPRSAVRESHILWGIAALDVVAFLIIRSLHPSGDAGTVVLFGIGIGSFAVVGALLRTRVPGNPIGTLLLAAGTVLSAAMIVNTYADLGELQVPLWPWIGLARVVGPTLFVLPFLIALIGVPLVFPDGRLPSRRFRWVVKIAIADAVALSLGGLTRGWREGAFPIEVPDPVALDLVIGALSAVFVVATVVSFGGGVLAVWLQFRRGDPIQRQQVKWLVAVVGLGAIVLPVSFIVPLDAVPELASAFTNITVLTLFALPVVIAIAVLRYRLFEIDRVISRTIGWALVTGVLVTVFTGTVVGLQAILDRVTQGETLAVAASTLIAFALFQPVRRRVQTAVDRRFDRARYDGDRTAAAFTERLREQVDLAGLEADLALTIDATLHPSSTSVWIRRPRRETTG
jgi:hypothetical protein